MTPRKIAQPPFSKIDSWHLELPLEDLVFVGLFMFLAAIYGG